MGLVVCKYVAVVSMGTFWCYKNVNNENASGDFNETNIFLLMFVVFKSHYCDFQNCFRMLVDDKRWVYITDMVTGSWDDDIELIFV